MFLSQVQTYLGPRQHEQNVGELWRVSDDPSDPVFYSSCMIHGPLERTFKGTTCGDACKLSASSVSSTEWKFGEQCIGCNLAKRQYKTTQTPKWVLGNDENRPCHQCEQWEAPHDEEKCQNTIGWDNGAKKDCYQYQNNGWCTPRVVSRLFGTPLLPRLAPGRKEVVTGRKEGKKDRTTFDFFIYF